MQSKFALLSLGAALVLAVPAHAQRGDPDRPGRSGERGVRPVNADAERGRGERQRPAEARSVEAPPPPPAAPVARVEAAPAVQAAPAIRTQPRWRAANDPGEARGERGGRDGARAIDRAAMERDLTRRAAAASEAAAARSAAARQTRDPAARWDTDADREENALAARRNGRDDDGRDDRNDRDDRNGNGRWDGDRDGNDRWDGRDRTDWDRDRNRADRDRDRDHRNWSDNRYRNDWNRNWYSRGWDPYWATGRYDRYGRPWTWNNRYGRYDWRYSYDPRFYYGATWAWDPFWSVDPYWWRPYGSYNWNYYGYQYGYGVRPDELVRADPIIARWALVRFDRDRNGYLGPNETNDAARELRRLADVNADRRINDREYNIALRRLQEFAYRY